MLKASETNCRYAMLAILGVIAVIIVRTFRHYGVTWDEELQSQYGLAIVDYYTTFFADRRFGEIYNLYLYGGLFDGIASVIDSFTPFSVYETRHLVNALFGLLGLWGTWRLGRFFSPVAGLAALILLALTPMYYGHMFNNPKDIPFAAGMVWTLYYMAKSLAELPRVRVRVFIKLGVVLGFTLGIRVGGVLALAFWGAVLAGWLAAPLVRQRNLPALRQAVKNGWLLFWRLTLPVTLIAYLVMLACWPWAQQDPVTNPLRAFNEFRHFPQDVEILLDGTTYSSMGLPWFYVPLYFCVQLPESVLFLLGLGAVVLPFTLPRLDPVRRWALLLVVLTAFGPIFYATVSHPALYDAVRHFIFTVPLMCVLAGLTAQMAFGCVMDRLKTHRLRTFAACGLAAASTLALMSQLYLMIELHPYEYIYANTFVGGLPGIYGRYELDYWGSSFKEAAKKLQATVAREGGVPPGKIYRIAICGPWDAAMIYLPPDYEPVVADRPAEFFLSTTRWMCQDMRPGREMFRISRLGVPLAVVKDLRHTK